MNRLVLGFVIFAGGPAGLDASVRYRDVPPVSAARAVDPVSSTGPLQWLSLAAFVVVGAGGFFAIKGVRAHFRRKRRDALAGLAARRGFAFAAENPSIDCSSDLRLLDRGHSHVFRNIMRGDLEGLAFLLFDHEFSTGGGKSERFFYRTVAAFRVNGSLSPFDLRPEGLRDKISALLGAQDIDFPESPSFSDAYLLRGSDAARTRQDFDPNVLAFFSGHPGWCAYGGGPWVGLFRGEERVLPERLWEFLEEARLGASFFRR